MTVLKTVHIAPYQLISLYVLCRSGAFFSLSAAAGQEGFAAAFGSMLSELAIPLLLLPGFFLLRQYPGDSIAGCCIRLCGNWVGKLLTTLYLVFFLVSLAVSLCEFQMFSSVSLYEGPSGGLVLLSAAAVAFFCSFRGLEPIARLAFPSALLLGVSFLLTIVLGLFRSDPVLLAPFSLQQAIRMPEALCRETGKIIDGLLWLMLLSSLPRGRGAAYWGGPLICAGSAFFRRFVEFGTLGVLAVGGTYPFFLVTRSVGLFVTSWLLGALVRFSLFFAVINQLVHMLFPEPARKAAFFFCAAVVAAFGLWCAWNQQLLAVVTGILETGLPLAFLGLLLPATLLLISRFRRPSEELAGEEAKT